MSDKKATICNWCLREAPVQRIPEKLWHVWTIITTEDPITVTHRNICDECKSHYEDFSVDVERCKIKDEPSIDIEHRPFKEEPSSDSECSSNFLDEPKSLIDVATVQTLEEEPLIDRLEIIHRDHNYNKSCDERSSQSVLIHARPDSNVTCSRCDITFKRPSQLRVHSRIHVDGRTFDCPYCDKTFNYPSWLETHLRIHTDGRPYGCSYCDKSFKKQFQLKAHSRIHTGDRPFGCSICDKTFVESGNLKRHLRTHTGEKTVQCQLCGVTFAKSVSLKRHIQKHTSESS